MIDANQDAGSVRFPMAPDVASVVDYAFPDVFPEPLAILCGPDIERRHLQEFIARISVVRSGGGIDG